MFCPSCGTTLVENAKFCPACGTVLKESAPVVNDAPIIPEQYQPLSPWAYFGLQILFAIPVVGFIFLIIFSCKKSNLNRRNFARSYWCSLAIFGIALIVFLLIALIFSFDPFCC